MSDEILLIPGGVDMRPGKAQGMAAWYVCDANRARFEFASGADAYRFYDDNQELIVSATDKLWRSPVIEPIDLKNGRFGLVVLAPNMLTEGVEVTAMSDAVDIAK